MTWCLDSWKNYTIKYVPKYEDDFPSTKSELSSKSPIVNYLEIENLLSLLNKSYSNNSFILQLGDCAELFVNTNEKSVKAQLGLFNEFISYLPKGTDVIKIGRIAGQYAKPRSSEFEVVDNIKVHSYRGDIYHDYYSREISSTRMLAAYENSKEKYKIIKANSSSLFISHEALNLHYEESLTKLCKNGKYYNLSAHMLWLGERTRFINSAHIEYLRGISNPIGIKVSHKINSQELIEIIKTLNPDNNLGKIILINRMGELNIQKYFEKVICDITKNRLNVIWMCDPMHGNTTTVNNYKTRKLNSIMNELYFFQHILKKHNIGFQGIHLEAENSDIYECIDHNSVIKPEKYKTLCDPRLNKQQSLEIATLITKILKNEK